MPGSDWVCHQRAKILKDEDGTANGAFINYIGD